MYRSCGNRDPENTTEATVGNQDGPPNIQLNSLLYFGCVGIHIYVVYTHVLQLAPRVFPMTFSALQMLETTERPLLTVSAAVVNTPSKDM